MPAKPPRAAAGSSRTATRQPCRWVPCLGLALVALSIVPATLRSHGEGGTRRVEYRAIRRKGLV